MAHNLVSPHLYKEGRTNMFSIRWVTHGNEENDSMMEKSLLPDADAVIASCLERLPLMQERNLVSPPDGFIVFDGKGHEVRRWFGSARPAFTVREAVKAVMVRVRDRGETLAVTAAIEEFRHKFPDLQVSDSEIIEVLESEASPTGVHLEFDIGEPATSGALERWDDEGGAIKQRLTEPERQEARRRIINDTDGSKRRAKHIEERNRLI